MYVEWIGSSQQLYKNNKMMSQKFYLITKRCRWMIHNTVRLSVRVCVSVCECVSVTTENVYKWKMNAFIVCIRMFIEHLHGFTTKYTHSTSTFHNESISPIPFGFMFSLVHFLLHAWRDNIMNKFLMGHAAIKHGQFFCLPNRSRNGFLNDFFHPKNKHSGYTQLEI